MFIPSWLVCSTGLNVLKFHLCCSLRQKSTLSFFFFFNYFCAKW